MRVDTLGEIETLWRNQDDDSNVLVTYDSDAAAWSVTNMFEKFVCIPKMLRSSQYGMSFALDIFDNSFNSGGIQLKKIFAIDH